MSFRNNIEDYVGETRPLKGKSPKLTTVHVNYVENQTSTYFLYSIWGLFVLGFVAAMIVVFVFPPTLTPDAVSSSLLPDIPLTQRPSLAPTVQPTDLPTLTPTRTPTTKEPTDSPTQRPTQVPTTRSPTDAPTTVSPTLTPTVQPTDPPCGAWVNMQHNTTLSRGELLLIGLSPLMAIAGFIVLIIILIICCMCIIGCVECINDRIPQKPIALETKARETPPKIVIEMEPVVISNTKSAAKTS